jgi:hypothetical protein
MAAEGLGELRRVSVADRRRHLLDGARPVSQQLHGVFHAHPLELAPKARSTGLRERSLELAARGRYLSRDGVEGDGLVPKAKLDHLDGFAAQLGASVDRVSAH